MIGGLFPRVGATRAAEPDDDPALVAARVSEMIGNSRAASESERLRVSEEEAARPPMTTTVVDKGDGTRSISLDNVPNQAPGDRVRLATNEPYAQLIERLLQSGAKHGQAVVDRFDKTMANIDAQLGTREGRVALAKSIGFVDPRAVPGEFVRSGFQGFRQKRYAYEQLLADPEKLKQAVMAKQFAEMQDAAEALRPFAADSNSMRTAARADAREERLTSTAELGERRSALVDLARFDTSHFESPDKVIEWMKAGYGDRWKDVAGYLEPAARIKYAEDLVAKQQAKLKEEIAAERLRLSQAADERSRKESEARIRNLESLIRKRDQPDLRKIGRGAALGSSTDLLLDYIDDPGYDQESVIEALRVKEDQLKKEQDSAARAIERKRRAMAAIRDKQSWQNQPADVEQVEAYRVEIEQLAERRAAINDELARISTARGAKKQTKAAPSGGGALQPTESGDLIYTPR